MGRKLVGIVWFLGLVGCGKTLQLNLVIHDPCNQQALADSQLEHLEVLIESPDLERPVRTTWSIADGKGSLDGMQPVTDAVLSVIGRASNASGNPGEAVAATTVGLLDLSGDAGGDVVDIEVVVGKIGSFISTTNAQQKECSVQVAARRGHTATALPDGTVFIAGGSKVDAQTYRFWSTTEIYDPETGLFNRGPEMQWVREGHAATALADGRVLLTGGVGKSDQQDLTTWRIAQIYDAKRGKLSAEPIAMLDPRAHHTATLLEDGRVLLAGGLNGTRELGTTEIFDPRTETFVAGPTLASPRSHHTAVRVGRAVVAVIGGRGASGVLSTIEFVNLDTNQIVAGPALTTGRSHAVAALVPGKDAVMVAGGFDALVTDPHLGSGLDSIEVVQLSTQNLATSTVVCSGLKLKAKRGDPSLAVVGTSLLVVGGVSASGQLNGSADLLEFSGSNVCTPTIDAVAGGLSVSRAGAETTTLLGGDVLLTGGYTIAQGSPASVIEGEIFVVRR